MKTESVLKVLKETFFEEENTFTKVKTEIADIDMFAATFTELKESIQIPGIHLFHKCFEIIVASYQ